MQSAHEDGQQGGSLETNYSKQNKKQVVYLTPQAFDKRVIKKLGIS